MSCISRRSKHSFPAAVSSPPANGSKRTRTISSSSQTVMIPIMSSSNNIPSDLDTTKSFAALSASLASSAPPTPFFLSSSASFFPPVRPSDSRVRRTPSIRSDSSRPTDTNVADLHREAFISLRRSLADSGEGFIRRMREWEMQRHEDKSSIPQNVHHRDKRENRPRGRRGRNSRADHRMISGHSSSNLPRSYKPRPHKHSRDDDYLQRCFDGREDTDDDDIIPLDDSTQIPCDAERRQRKRRAVSLENQMDISDSPNLFDESEEETYPTHTFHATFNFPFTDSTTRSSSPFSYINTSDDETSHPHTHSLFPSPHRLHRPKGWSRSADSPQTYLGIQVPASADYDSPDTSPLSSSPMPSSFSFSPKIPSISQAFPVHSSGAMNIPNDGSSQDPSDKAIAALTLALANGAGCLADYEFVREAQGNLAETEAGALWD